MYFKLYRCQMGQHSEQSMGAQEAYVVAGDGMNP